MHTALLRVTSRSIRLVHKLLARPTNHFSVEALAIVLRSHPMRKLSSLSSADGYGPEVIQCLDVQTNIINHRWLIQFHLYQSVRDI